MTAKKTPRQNRKASATELAKALPAKPGVKGPVVLSAAAVRRAIKRLAQ